MSVSSPFDPVAIELKCRRLVRRLLEENPRLRDIMQEACSETEVRVGVRLWVEEYLQKRPDARAFYRGKVSGRQAFEKLSWRDYAAIRLLDYIDHAGMSHADPNLDGAEVVSDPLRMLWLAVRRGLGGGTADFFEDMLQLFRQFSGRSQRRMPSRGLLERWMERWPSGLDPRVVDLRRENKRRIIEVLIDELDAGVIAHRKFTFEPGLSRAEKVAQMERWWEDPTFHLQFAVRRPERLNKLLGGSLDPETVAELQRAKAAGIPFFINPYYLSLLNVRVPYYAVGADLAIRDYIFYKRPLIEQFGRISAWEKEDEARPGQPNAAGWLLPESGQVHRRYPEVAIMIPATMGRACGGLCAPCQRMYDFQSGKLNFQLSKLKPGKNWKGELQRLMQYFEHDAQLRDILITGGDALMTRDKPLSLILEAVYQMARRKREANAQRADGDKYAELTRVRLGTRLPVYLPQRVSPELTEILRDFRQRGREVGIRQFVIQTHFESPMEVTPEAKRAIQRLASAGWTVTNQLVFTAAASRRGHTAKLRQVLGEVGVLPYYTFSVKGYLENQHSFATNARALQEQQEEKVHGRLPEELLGRLRRLPEQAERMPELLAALREEADLPFLATDRNVLNMPGVGKSLTFRVIGITRDGRRILSFDHDHTRWHSPIIERMGRITIVESKSVAAYRRQLDAMGEDVEEYCDVWGYSLGETEPRMPLYDYPDYGFKTTRRLTNLQLDEADAARLTA